MKKTPATSVTHFDLIDRFILGGSNGHSHKRTSDGPIIGRINVAMLRSEKIRNPRRGADARHRRQDSEKTRGGAVTLHSGSVHMVAASLPKDLAKSASGLAEEE